VESIPIKVEDAKKYKGYKEDEVKIASFLTNNKGNAFTEEEIEKGIGKTPIVYTPDEKGSYWTWQNVGLFTVGVIDGIFFRTTLEEMVKKGKIRVSEVAGKKYYFID
jgi:hypothetical protein